MRSSARRYARGARCGDTSLFPTLAHVITAMKMTEYADTAPGRCYRCKGRLQRVSAGISYRGQYAFVRAINELGQPVVLHVSCGERYRPRPTADYDHYAVVAGTSKKPVYD